MNTEVEFEGYELKLGRVVYVVPALDLDGLIRYINDIEDLMNMQVGGFITLKQAETVRDVLTCALKRNYPEITAERVSKLVDMRNLGEVIGAIMGTAGLQKTAANGASKGEAESPVSSSRN